MSIFSDYACGALSEEEFKSECARMNAEDRWERGHMFDDLYDDEDSEDDDIELD